MSSSDFSHRHRHEALVLLCANSNVSRTVDFHSARPRANKYWLTKLAMLQPLHLHDQLPADTTAVWLFSPSLPFSPLCSMPQIGPQSHCKTVVNQEWVLVSANDVATADKSTIKFWSERILEAAMQPGDGPRSAHDLFFICQHSAEMFAVLKLQYIYLL